MASTEPQVNSSKARTQSILVVGVGFSLLATSFLPWLAGGRERWTKEQALEYQQASLRIQELTHKLASQTPDTVSLSIAGRITTLATMSIAAQCRPNCGNRSRCRHSMAPKRKKPR